MLPLSLQAIRQAQQRISDHVRHTPLLEMDFLEALHQKKVIAKCETLQITGSFKMRGATNCILNNLAQAQTKGVIAASAGNHAQGVAAICHKLGIQATIVMPVGTPVIKTQNTAKWGAQVELVGEVYDDSQTHAEQLAQEQGGLLVPPFFHPDVMAGQGTIALEMLSDPRLDEMEAMVIPIGGGGLACGMVSALKALKPQMKIYGVTSVHCPSTWKSFQIGTIVHEPTKRTLAEGVAVKKRVPLILNYLRSTLTDLIAVEEETIAYAISLLAERTKMIHEGSSALTVAAILENKIPETKIAMVLSGGNIDIPTLSRVLRRGLVAQDRLIRLNIMVSDAPGGLAKLTQVLAQTGANIIHIFHKRNTVNVAFGDALAEVELETKGPLHTQHILTTLAQSGFPNDRIL